jgi:hypothetical protein|tara:strand:+ start:64 stop:321 length:258 start_codon:yes stop_codon:yes gene_type:complete
MEQARVTTRKTDKGIIVPEKVWITFLNNGFQEFWMPLTDWDGNQLFWIDGLQTQAKKIAAQKFDCKFGIAPCSQKEVGNACIDNF